MILYFHKQFEKQLKKMTKKQRLVVKSHLEIFLQNPYHNKLNNHGLRGKYKNYRSINISGDLRAIYKLSEDASEAVFIYLGNHNNLYSS